MQEDQALIELLAQGQRWFEQLLRGEVASLRAIAQSAGKSERHVRPSDHWMKRHEHLLKHAVELSHKLGMNYWEGWAH
jgi:hypothetical protein